MFGSSTQLNHWTFKSDVELDRMRREANHNFVEKFGEKMSESDRKTHFLSADEELILMRAFVCRLREFCHGFRDPRDSRIRMPAAVTTTATHYFLRFYLYNSVMDYHPKDILHTCVYLACKIEEFYVTINDYVYNVSGTNEEKLLTASTILNSELQTTQELQFHLIVHQPYRPVEGLMIDIKTRYPSLGDVESLRGAVEEFLERVHTTDAIILYAPSQLALAAVTTAASKLGQNLDSYVTDTLFASAQERLPTLIDAVRKIKRFVKNADNKTSPSVISNIESRLEVCRNPANNPTTEEYRIIQSRLDQDDEDFPLVSSVSATTPGLEDEGVEMVVNDSFVEEHGGGGGGGSSSSKNTVDRARVRGGGGIVDTGRTDKGPMENSTNWALGDGGGDWDIVGGVGDVVGVGLGMRSASGGVILDGGVIDDDDDCVIGDDEDDNLGHDMSIGT